MPVYCPYCGSETEWMTTEQVAAMFGVDKLTVRRWIKEERFPGTVLVEGMFSRGVYRIPVTAVVPLMEARRGKEDR